MKIIKLFLLFLILSIFIEIVKNNTFSKKKFKSKARIRSAQFDPTILLVATRAYFIKILNPEKKTDEEVQTCIDQVSEDLRVEIHAQKLMKKIKKIIKKNLQFSLKDSEKFLEGLNSSKIGFLKMGDRHLCGDVLKKSILDDKHFKDERFQNLLKNEMINKLGLVAYNPQKTNYLSHLINIRPSRAQNPHFFNRLNGNFKKI